MILIVLFIGVLLALAVLPQIWVKNVLTRHADERAEFPGTGAEFARHVLDGMGLSHVRVEESRIGDHYDPEAKAIRLSPDHHSRRSLAAVVVAAHEVGHAMQDATGYGPLAARSRLARQAQRVESVGAFVMLAAPLLMLVSKSPHMLILQVMAGLLIMAFTVLMHLTTLPVEFDASFRRALPLLREGGYIGAKDQAAARSILRAAAFTYVASAAMSLLDIVRWFRVLRF